VSGLRSFDLVAKAFYLGFGSAVGEEESSADGDDNHQTEGR
jgi:hypothetical protein